MFNDKWDDRTAKSQSESVILVPILFFSTIHQQKNFSNILWRIQIEILPRLESSLSNSKPI